MPESLEFQDTFTVEDGIEGDDVVRAYMTYFIEKYREKWLVTGNRHDAPKLFGLVGAFDDEDTAVACHASHQTRFGEEATFSINDPNFDPNQSVPTHRQVRLGVDLPA